MAKRSNMWGVNMNPDSDDFGRIEPVKAERGALRPKRITVTPVSMIAVSIDRSYHLLTEDEATDLYHALGDSIGG